MIKSLLISAIILILDIFTKDFAVKNLMPDGEIIVVEDFFKLVYLENRGASFGILQNGRTLFIIVTVAVLIWAFYIIYKDRAKMTPGLYTLFGVFLGGTLGNFIERVHHAYVVDFLSFKIFGRNFPVFNVADIAISVSLIVFVIMIFSGKVKLDD